MKKTTQKISTFWMIATVFIFSFGTMQALACSNLGPEKHMGVVLQTDPIQGVFSLMDAETRVSIEFKIDADLLKQVHLNDTIVVTFEKTENELIAKKIDVHRSAKGLL